MTTTVPRHHGPGTLGADLLMTLSGTLRVLIVGDPDKVLGGTEKEQIAAGLEVFTAADGSAGLLLVGELQPDVVVAHAELAGVGIEAFVAAVRRWSSIPVLVTIPAQDDSADTAFRVLEAGASGLCHGVLDARRLAEAAGRSLPKRSGRSRTLLLGPLVLDCGSMVLRGEQGQTQLSVKEYLVLVELMAASPQIRTAAELVETGGFPQRQQSKALQVAIGKLRRKLNVVQARGADYLATVRGVGYRMGLPETFPDRQP
ncbi:winged helix-turn-helix domain-containing protein [Micrococcus luteus]|uniref:response regulator transcription factor n=1 Tax=Micrococcus terreus TaxID=574650 RepID=UPI00301A7AF8|nr:winged helix-turn-helix domain-containing protein [Micrococcus luteus]MCV7573562.1 winged helix-turn-helix domain-containing protein [Micrococcus luteus]